VLLYVVLFVIASVCVSVCVLGCSFDFNRFCVVMVVRAATASWWLVVVKEMMHSSNQHGPIGKTVHTLNERMYSSRIFHDANLCPTKRAQRRAVCFQRKSPCFCVYFCL